MNHGTNMVGNVVANLSRGGICMEGNFLDLGSCCLVGVSMTMLNPCS